MSKIHRNGRATAKTSIEDEIAHLRGLDLKGLRARWQSVLQRPAPGHLPRHLLFVKAAVEGRLPRGIGIERLRDPPTEWSRQFEALGLNPE